MSGAADFFRNLQRNLPQLERQILQGVIQVEAEAFHAENFRKEGFTDVGFKKWKERKFSPDSNPKKGGLLVKSSAMKRHATKGTVRGKQVDFVFPLAYMKIQNEGGKIRVTPKMKKFFWAKYYKTKRDVWKNLALTKKSHIEIPKRQFVGKSAHLEARIRRKAIALLKKRIR